MFLGTFIGNLGKDAETVTGSNGRELMKLTLAVDQGKNKGTVWVDVLMPQNPNLTPYLVKGTKIFIQGRVDVNVSRNYLNVNCFADQLQLLNNRPTVDDQQQQQSPTQQEGRDPMGPDNNPGEPDPFGA